MMLLRLLGPERRRMSDMTAEDSKVAGLHGYVDAGNTPALAVGAGRASVTLQLSAYTGTVKISR